MLLELAGTSALLFLAVACNLSFGATFCLPEDEQPVLISARSFTEIQKSTGFGSWESICWNRFPGFGVNQFSGTDCEIDSCDGTTNRLPLINS